MQAAHLWNGNDACQRRWLYGPRIRRVLAEREVRSCSVIVLEVARQRPTERGFAEDNQMIETFPANGPDDAFDVGSLPGGPRRRKHFLDPQGLDVSGEIEAEDAVAIPQQGSAGFGQTGSVVRKTPVRARRAVLVTFRNVRS